MSDAPLRFVPSRVEGVPEVTSVTVHPDRIELASNDHIVTHRFADLAKWPAPALVWKALHKLGVGRRWLPIADRDWFHEPADMFFELYSSPRVKVFMPRDESKDDYGASMFARVQDLIRSGGYHTLDLG